MDVIDETGRLFGVVNVIDALVILLVVAVVVAGGALVFGGQSGEEPEPTRYATVSYTVPLESGAALLDSNDTLAVVDGGETYDVMDVYRSFTPDGAVRVVARVAYAGRLTATGDRLYGGESVALVTSSYRVDAAVLAANQSGSTLHTDRVPVVLSVEATPSATRTIAPGQRVTIGDHTIATIVTVQQGNAANASQRLWVGVELHVLDRGTVTTYGGQPLTVDTPITLITDSTTISGRLYAVGTTTPPVDNAETQP